MPEFNPMVIGLFCGNGKPSSLSEYLGQFVDELNNILENGILINDKKFNVRIRCFICDSPARAFLKGVINFNGQHGCIKCTSVGEYSYISRCNVFPRINMPLRMDIDFRNRADEDHHKCYTILEKLPIDMVKDFIIADELHLIHLGVMKRFILGWRDGTFKNFDMKWCAQDIKEITTFLLNCKMPLEIHRAVRGLDCLSHWKGLEFRTFFHYIGPVVLKKCLPIDVYNNFMKLFCAITICSSNSYSYFYDLAEKLLDDFVQEYIEIYGVHHTNSNIHNLSHIMGDVRRFGNLASISAYPFESKPNRIEHLLRSGRNPLQQAAKRLYELSQMENIKGKTIIYPILNKANNEAHETYSKVKLIDGFCLSNDTANKWFLTKKNEIVAMKYAKNISNKIHIYGSSLKTIDIFFDNPFKSSHLHIYASCCAENDPQLYTICEIKCKMVAVDDGRKTVFIPLLHTLDLL